jgi:hypothetical protein
VVVGVKVVGCLGWEVGGGVVWKGGGLEGGWIGTYVGGRSWLSSSSSSSGGSSRSLYPVPSGACESGIPELLGIDMALFGIIFVGFGWLEMSTVSALVVVDCLGGCENREDGRRCIIHVCTLHYRVTYVFYHLRPDRAPQPLRNDPNSQGDLPSSLTSLLPVSNTQPYTRK